LSHTKSVSEFITFTSRLLASRTEPGTRQQVEKDSYVCYSHSRTSGICGVLITDATYPERVAFSLVYKALLEFEKNYPSTKWQDNSQLYDNCLHLAALDQMIAKYHDATEADDLLKIKKDIEETKTIMHQALENVLEKGEKMEDLVSKSGDLSFHSKAFYNSAKDQNSCCNFQ